MEARREVNNAEKMEGDFRLTGRIYCRPKDLNGVQFQNQLDIWLLTP
jgi:hypothetical protein